MSFIRRAPIFSMLFLILGLKTQFVVIFRTLLLRPRLSVLGVFRISTPRFIRVT